jgi:hypothetical protein
VADLSIEFANGGTYPGHFKEKGYNALFIYNAANCFARNLRIVNAGKLIASSRRDKCWLWSVCRCVGWASVITSSVVQVLQQS